MPHLHSALSEKSFSVKSSNHSNEREEGENQASPDPRRESEDLTNELLDDMTLTIPLNLDDKELNSNSEQLPTGKKNKRLRKIRPCLNIPIDS